MSSLERRLLKSVLLLPNISTLLDSKIRVDMFIEETRHKYIMEYIIKIFRDTGEFPTIEQIHEKFELNLSDIEISFDFNQYAIELKRRFLINKIQDDVYPSLKTYIKNDQLDSAKNTLGNFLCEMEDLTNNDGVIISLQENTEERLQAYMELKNRRTIEIGIPLPWEIVNQYTFGIMPGEFWVFAAKQNVGKTWLAIHMANYIWTQGYNVMFISLESPTIEIIRRWDSLHAKIPYQDLRGAKLSESELKTYIESLEKIKETKTKANIIGDGKIKTPYDVKMLIQDNRETDIVIIDGLYFLKMNDRYEDKYLQMSAVAHALQSISLTTDVPILGTTQFQRKGETEDEVAYSHDFVNCAHYLVGMYGDKEMRINKQRFLKFLKTRESERFNFVINFNLDSGNLGFEYEADEKMEEIS